MNQIKVYYDSQEIVPTPLVNRTHDFIDFGGRWGNIEKITLNGFLTGIGANAFTSIQSVTNIFTGLFKTLEVKDDGNSVYKWNYAVLEDISFPQSHFHQKTFTPYSVKLAAYNVPSGVLEPSNEYSFTQNSNGTVEVAHTISAKGVKNSQGALNNAISFVNLFVNKNPFVHCIPAFIPNGSGIRTSIEETIDRIGGSYTVTENYLYSTGVNNPYILITALNINNSKTNDYTILSLDAKWQGSTVDGNITELGKAVTGTNLASLIESYGLDSDLIYLNSSSLTVDSGKNTVDYKGEYISGLSNDYSGYFDYVVSTDKNLINSNSNWKIEGEYICKGPINFRRDRIAAFKTANSAQSYIPYLKNLVETSALYTGYGDFPLLTPPKSLSINENTGLATLKLSASFEDTDRYLNFIEPIYEVSIEPPIWIYEMMPAANIEGHYIIQDLQMKKAAKVKISFSAETSGVTDQHIKDANSFTQTLADTYISNGFLTSDAINTGVTSISQNREYIGPSNLSTGISEIKVYGSISSNYLRIPNYKFGY
jgi:hypothetical protein